MLLGVFHNAQHSGNCTEKETALQRAEWGWGLCGDHVRSVLKYLKTQKWGEARLESCKAMLQYMHRGDSRAQVAITGQIF